MVLEWVTVSNDGANNYVNPEGRYLILAGVTSGGVVDYFPANVVTQPNDSPKFLDNVLQGASISELIVAVRGLVDQSALRKNRTMVGNYQEVLIALFDYEI